MTILEARDKICPFMSAPLHEPSGQEGIIVGISVPFMTYCTADLCMAWEPAEFPITSSDKGYCKLVEEGIHH